MDIRKLPLLTLVFIAAPVLAAPPIANNDARTIPQNVPITINVLSNDSDPDNDGISINSIIQPETGGTVTVNNDGGVYFVPTQDFIGEVRFSYDVIDDSELAEVSEFAVVVVNVVEANLSENVPEGNQESVAVALDQVCGELAGSNTSDVGAGRASLTENCEALLALEANNPQAAARAVQQIAPEETLTLSKLGANASEFQQEIVGNRLSQLSQGLAFASRGRIGWSGQLNGGAAGDESILAKIGVFASVQIEDADKKSSNAESGFDYTANALTVGADYAFSSDWVVGGAFGWTGNELEYKNGDGSVESDIYNAIAYSTYNRQNFTFDTQLGYGGSQIDLTRNISYGEPGNEFNATTRGETSGQEWFLSMQTQYLWSLDAWTLYPRASLNYSTSKVNGYADTDAGGWDVILSDQKVERWTFNGGLQATYAINTNWGVIVPNADVSMIADIKTDQDLVTGRFAYAPADSPAFVLGAEEPDSVYYQIGVGFSALLPRGMSAFAGLRQTVGYTDYRSLQFQGGFRKEI